MERGYLSNLSRILAPTLSRQLFTMARQFDNVIDFTLGDPDLPTPKPICDAVTRAINSGFTHYSPNAGISELREAIASVISNETGIGFEQNNVLVTVGATEAIYLSFMACLNPGDEVIILAPFWVQYENMVKLIGGKPIIIDHLKDDFTPDLNSIVAAISEKTKIIVINSPNNPSGVVYRDGFLKELSGLARKFNLLIFADEVYRSLSYDIECPSIARYCPEENLVLFNSFSKQYAMTGWRVGYVVANSELIKAIEIFQQNVAVCAATPNQYAALEAIRGETRYREEIVRTFHHRRDVLIRELNKVSGLKFRIPEGTFYTFVDISSTGRDSLSFCFSLLEQKKVAVIPGVAFGAAFDNYIRLAFTLDDNRIIEGINRIREFVE